VTPEWVLHLIAMARKVMPKDFVGQVEVNCFKGNVSNVTVKQTYKEKEEAACPSQPTASGNGSTSRGVS
jgi:hypothetical protein